MTRVGTNTCFVGSARNASTSCSAWTRGSWCSKIVNVFESSCTLTNDTLRLRLESKCHFFVRMLLKTTLLVALTASFAEDVGSDRRLQTLTDAAPSAFLR